LELRRSNGALRNGKKKLIKVNGEHDFPLTFSPRLGKKKKVFIWGV